MADEKQNQDGIDAVKEQAAAARDALKEAANAIHGLNRSIQEEAYKGVKNMAAAASEVATDMAEIADPLTGGAASRVNEAALKEAMDNLAASLDETSTEEILRSQAATLSKAAARKLSHRLNAAQAGMLADQVLVLRATYGADLATRCIAFISKEELERKL